MTPKTKSDLRVETFARGVIRWRWPIVLLSVFVTAAIGSGLRGLFFDTDYGAFFGEENPQLRAFEELQNVYTKERQRFVRGRARRR